jgi:hypothetical protein
MEILLSTFLLAAIQVERRTKYAVTMVGGDYPLSADPGAPYRTDLNIAKNGLPANGRTEIMMAKIGSISLHFLVRRLTVLREVVKVLFVFPDN